MHEKIGASKNYGTLHSFSRESSEVRNSHTKQVWLMSGRG